MLLLAAVFYVAHILEEAPGYIRWFNTLVAPPMPEGNLLQLNAPSLAVTTVLAIIASTTLRRGALLVLFAWLSYFMFANALFHIVATIRLAQYSPGVITAVVLYLPYFGWLACYLRREVHVRSEVLAAVGVVFALPMLIQGYMIVFRHSTLF
jgi:hypothetical protein